MSIQYAESIAEKSHVLHVGFLTADENGNPIITEIPVRKSSYESMTAAKKLAYAVQCAEFHHPTDRAKRDARRAAWDADDKARADAATLAAKRAEEAKFIVVPQGFVKDKDGSIVGVQVKVTHQGHVASVVIANDPANAEANARIEWQKSKDAADAVVAALNAFAIG